MKDTNIEPMTAAQRTAKKHFLCKIEPGMKLLITDGIKQGREAVYRGERKDNPWMLDVIIAGRASIVRWNWVVRA